MDKEEFKAMLKDALRDFLSVYVSAVDCGNMIKVNVTIEFDGEEIDSDFDAA